MLLLIVCRCWSLEFRCYMRRQKDYNIGDAHKSTVKRVFEVIPSFVAPAWVHETHLYHGKMKLRRSFFAFFSAWNSSCLWKHAIFDAPTYGSPHLCSVFFGFSICVDEVEESINDIVKKHWCWVIGHTSSNSNAESNSSWFHTSPCFDFSIYRDEFGEINSCLWFTTDIPEETFIIM